MVMLKIEEYDLIKKYDVDTSTSFYDVYESPYCEEEILGDYVGEFSLNYDYEDNPAEFEKEFNTWLKSV